MLAKFILYIAAWAAIIFSHVSVIDTTLNPNNGNAFAETMLFNVSFMIFSVKLSYGTLD